MNSDFNDCIDFWILDDVDSGDLRVGLTDLVGDSDRELVGADVGV